MADTGRTLKRCGRRNSRGERLEKHCPKLSERGHGSWYLHCSATTLLGGRDRIRRGGFASQAAARLARDECLADSAPRRTAEAWTLERWLRHWRGIAAANSPTATVASRQGKLGSTRVTCSPAKTA